MNTEAQLRATLRRISANLHLLGELSSSQRIAIALILDRHDLLTDAYGTMLEAFDRLGPEWMQAALSIQRHGW